MEVIYHPVIYIYNRDIEGLKSHIHLHRIVSQTIANQRIVS